MSTEVAISAADARELTDRIRVGVEAIWELVKQAYKSRAWAVLGYDSWDDYCTREFGTSRIRLPREERQEVVSSMREIGMSTRAIASATGTSYDTVQRDLRRDRNLSPESEPAPVTGTDGKTYTPKPRPKLEPAPEEGVPMPEWEDVGTIPKSRLNDVAPPRPAPRPAPGFNPGDLDEINTPAEEPPKPRRTPITDQFTSAVVDLNRVLDKFHRIKNDKNFPANKNQIATLHGSDLARAISELQDLADCIN
jgi:transposase-like protein